MFLVFALAGKRVHPNTSTADDVNRYQPSISQCVCVEIAGGRLDNMSEGYALLALIVHVHLFVRSA